MAELENVKIIRDESTEEGRRIWADVDTAAARAPAWLAEAPARPDCRTCLFAKIQQSRRVRCVKGHWLDDLGRWPKTYATVVYFLDKPRPAPKRCRDFHSMED